MSYKKSLEKSFYRKYRDEFDYFNEVRDLYEQMLDMCEGTNEEALSNLKKWFLTKNKEVLKDYLSLLKSRIDDDKYIYLLEGFGLEIKETSPK